MVSGSTSFIKAQHKAQKLAKDPQRLSQLLQASKDKLKNLDISEDKFKGFMGTIKLFIRMIRAYLRGQYRVIPWKTLVLMVAALIYFVSPLDLIPDFIPITGFIDDISIILWIFNRFRHDMREFEAWEQSLVP